MRPDKPRSVTIRVAMTIAIGSACVAAVPSNHEQVRQFTSAKAFIHRGQWSDAIGAFEAFLHDHADSEFADDSLYWIGYCYERLPGQEAEAIEAYRKLAGLYPKSSWAKEAGERITVLMDRRIALIRERAKEG
ncbi:MAG: tetratricopeptide repeat protein, partial [Pseudomonas stutzeri]|nr:tetratricopeptide repeat protein [Stutzerimonas stutzeri]NIN81838.1 tetratricopeptide repeat protein [Stutzerimonas stutzeri]NIQ23686.1 tetratricopeptide repeat protein [Stutzerimonas stutzeri]NIQ42434.1 tetratricopeptide repeat protein [Stutzerimonas stutzeri]NIS57858.1 tetratricopeptide repeat protein [Stutzerimonas stutzeri]